MKVLIFDCETTGLPRHRRAKIENTCDWPFIVQLSWIVFDTSKNKLDKIRDEVVRLPPGLGICQESIKIHGITNERMLSEGVNIKSLLKEFIKDVKRCTMLIAHNINFDRQIISVEQIRNNMSKKSLLQNLRKKEYCTMKEGVVSCNIMIKERYTGKMKQKYPKLSELHKHQFGSIPSGLHNSLVDIIVCFRCFGKLYWDIDILTKNKQLNMLYNGLC